VPRNLRKHANNTVARGWKVIGNVSMRAGSGVPRLEDGSMNVHLLAVMTLMRRLRAPCSASQSAFSLARLLQPLETLALQRHLLCMFGSG